MPQEFYSIAECEQRTRIPPDFGPGDIVESCWFGSSNHRLTVIRIDRDLRGRYIFRSPNGVSFFAGYYRRPAGAARIKTNHRIGVPKNKLP